MSKKHKRSVVPSVAGGKTFETIPDTGAKMLATETQHIGPSTGGLTRSMRYFRSHLPATLIIAFLSLGALGAVLKYLDEDAQKQKQLASKDRSALSAINPFLVDPT